MTGRSEGHPPRWLALGRPLAHFPLKISTPALPDVQGWQSGVVLAGLGVVTISTCDPVAADRGGEPDARRRTQQAREQRRVDIPGG